MATDKARGFEVGRKPALANPFQRYSRLEADVGRLAQSAEEILHSAGGAGVGHPDFGGLAVIEAGGAEVKFASESHLDSDVDAGLTPPTQASTFLDGLRADDLCSRLGNSHRAVDRKSVV